MALSDYEFVGPVAYQGKPGCEHPICTRSPSRPESCMGYHCSYCDDPCGMMGHRCDAADAVLGEAARILSEEGK